eukprot:CAMPEP_0170297540 /NCGR_PEP_ID=MMETSP0116_2-20130129/48931_1 /TAXON_ID=400756 /ORGANISM="Durinskia baltica, Strain CSIRO CS-38" /LENGTH=43 /DNA_ID= /DNA_START= /DNA_END= /DNA_ORIENTATION=
MTQLAYSGRGESGRGDVQAIRWHFSAHRLRGAVLVEAPRSVVS